MKPNSDGNGVLYGLKYVYRWALFAEIQFAFENYNLNSPYVVPMNLTCSAWTARACIRSKTISNLFLTN